MPSAITSAASLEKMNIKIIDSKKEASMPSDVDSILVLTRGLCQYRRQRGGKPTPPVVNHMDIESCRSMREMSVDTGGAIDDVLSSDLEQNTE